MKCEVCKGTGIIEEAEYSDGPNFPNYIEEKCHTCKGTGEEPEKTINKIVASQVLSITPDELIVELEKIVWEAAISRSVMDEISKIIKHYTIPKWYSEEEYNDLNKVYTEWNNRERK